MTERHQKNDKRAEIQKIDETFLLTVLSELEERNERARFFKRNKIAGFIPRSYLRLFRRKKKYDYETLLKNKYKIMKAIRSSFACIEK